MSRNTPKVTKKLLYNYVANDPYHVVVVYAKWCGHCINMINKLGDKFKQYNILTFLEESQVDEDLKDYFPHVYVFEYGVPRDGSLQDVYELLGE